MELGISEYCKQFQLTDVTVNHAGHVFPYIDNFSSVGNVLTGDKITNILKAGAKNWRSPAGFLKTDIRTECAELRRLRFRKVLLRQSGLPREV